jgi:hypothetical protein
LNFLIYCPEAFSKKFLQNCSQEKINILIQLIIQYSRLKIQFPHGKYPISKSLELSPTFSNRNCNNLEIGYSPLRNSHIYPSNPNLDLTKLSAQRKWMLTFAIPQISSDVEKKFLII